MLGSVEVEAPFELAVPMFVHNWRALEARQKKFLSLGFLFTVKQVVSVLFTAYGYFRRHHKLRTGGVQTDLSQQFAVRDHKRPAMRNENKMFLAVQPPPGYKAFKLHT